MNTDKENKKEDLNITKEADKEDKILSDSGVIIVNNEIPKNKPELKEDVKQPISYTDKIEQEFKKELGSDTINTETHDEDTESLLLKLDSLHKTIESIRNTKKDSLEKELVEFKKLKEEIEGGLNKLKELEILSTKIKEEEDKIHKVDSMEKEVSEEIKELEEKITESK